MTDTKNTLGHALLQAFGLEDQRVKRLRLDIEAGDVPLLTITVYPRDVSAQQIEAIATEYEIISRSELRDTRERLAAVQQAEPAQPVATFDDPYRDHWAAIAEAAQKIAASNECGPAEAKALCAALDRLTEATLAEPVQPIDEALDGR